MSRILCITSNPIPSNYVKMVGKSLFFLLYSTTFSYFSFIKKSHTYVPFSHVRICWWVPLQKQKYSTYFEESFSHGVQTNEKGRNEAIFFCQKNSEMLRNTSKYAKSYRRNEKIILNNSELVPNNTEHIWVRMWRKL